MFNNKVKSCTVPGKHSKIFILKGAAVFWVLGASFFCIILHASFHNLEALQNVDGGDTLLTGSICEDV